jgi:hypothetical protein
VLSKFPAKETKVDVKKSTNLHVVCPCQQTVKNPSAPASDLFIRHKNKKIMMNAHKHNSRKIRILVE